MRLITKNSVPQEKPRNCATRRSINTPTAIMTKRSRFTARRSSSIRRWRRRLHRPSDVLSVVKGWISSAAIEVTKRYVDRRAQDLLGFTNLEHVLSEEGHDQGSRGGGRGGAAAGLEASTERGEGERLWELGRGRPNSQRVDEELKIIILSETDLYFAHLADSLARLARSPSDEVSRLPV